MAPVATAVAAEPQLPVTHRVQIPINSAAGVVLPAVRSGEHPEVQHIWIYCAEADEAGDLQTFCRSCRRPKNIPQIVQKRGVDSGYGPKVRRRVPKLPAPYGFGEWDEFLTDADALLVASLASSSLIGSTRERALEDCFPNLQSMRWPSLLVTDREKLVQAMDGSPRLQAALAEAASISVGDLLPAIIASDFGLLTGNLLMAPPVEMCDSLSLQDAILSLRLQRVAQPQRSSPEDFGLPGDPLSRTTSQSMLPQPSQASSAKVLENRCIIVSPGMYLQRQRRKEDACCFIYGVRALTLLSNGQGAYCCISPDGLRCVEVCGQWEVINGQIVIGVPMKHAPVAHFRLTGSLESVLDVSFDEPLHLSLEEFEAEFVPLDLADCMPEGSEHLYTGLVENESLREEVEDNRSEASRPGTSHLDGTAQLDATAQLDLDSTFDSHKFDLSRGSGLSQGPQSPVPEIKVNGSTPSSPPSPAKRARIRPMALGDFEETEGRRGSADFKQAAQAMRTPQHALFQISSEVSMSMSQAISAETDDEEELGALPEAFDMLIPSSPAPRLLGVDRGIAKGKLTFSSSRKTLDGNFHDASAEVDLTGGLPFIDAVKSLMTLVASISRPKRATTAAKSTCKLEPGTYSFSSGKEGDDDYKSLDMTLHADGTCKYQESAWGSTLRAISGATIWRVVDQDLVVDSKKAGSHGLSLRESRGTRMVERRAASVRIPIEVVRDRCKYSPFVQQLEPFPGHHIAPESRLIFGLIDPDSPVLRTMRCRPEKLPYLAFEQELRRHGLPCDKIISDFHFLDRDEDWQISVSDMRRLETYGTPLAAPEVMHELREAVVLRHGSLEAAFEALSESTPNRRVGLADFERFLVHDVEKLQGEKVPGSLQKLKDWVDNNSAEDRAAVFASLNPLGNPMIDLTDFMSLNLHAAVVALRRLEHFQNWISEQFGRSKEAYSQVYNAIDKERTRAISRKLFADGLDRLGYSSGTSASPMFALLDRNFTGELTPHNFKKLSDFSVGNILMSLETLKTIVDEMFRGVDDCFATLQRREQVLQGSTYPPRVVSFNTFSGLCRKAKLSTRAPDADFRMLFLFLALASGKPRSDGYLTKNEWSLLKGFNSRALAGSPARLRRILKQQYGDLDRAFEVMHTSWIEKALPQGLRQIALTRLARMLIGTENSATPQRDSPLSHGSASPCKPNKCFLPSVRSRSAASMRTQPFGHARVAASLLVPSMQRSRSCAGKLQHLALAS